MRGLTPANLQIDGDSVIRHLGHMETIIRAGFESENFTVEKDMTIDELIDVIVEHVDSLQEAMAAADMLGTIWDSGSYEGTGWRVWFVKRDPEPVLH